MIFAPVGAAAPWDLFRSAFIIAFIPRLRQSAQNRLRLYLLSCTLFA
jgi:hypothetical protein